MSTGLPPEYTTSPMYDMSSHTSFDTNGTFSNNVSLATTMGPDPFGAFGPMAKYRLFWAMLYINNIYLWVIFTIGTPGNIASVVTILRMPPITTTTGYVALLSIMDTLAIITKLMFHQFTLYDVDIGEKGCQSLYLLGTFFMMYANWILVAMSVERFIAIWFPLKVMTLVTKKKSIGAMTALGLFLLCLNLHFLWTTTNKDTPNGGRDCGYKDEYEYFFRYAWFRIDGILYAILPCVFVVLFNVLIIIGIRRSHRIQRDLTNNKNDQMAEKYRQQRQITIMLIVVSAVFVLLVLPNSIFFIVSPFWKYTPLTYEHVEYAFTYQLVFLFSDFNHTVNFYLYFLTARRFRRRFIDSICCRNSSRKPFTSLTANSNVSNTSIYTTQTSMGGLHRDGANNNSRKYTTTTT